jgi:uncharacterized protein YndB with AHSA1/START domain
MLTKPSLTLKRRINAPPAKVYAAWTDPQKLMGWFGPEGAKALSAEADVRVGGRYHIVFVMPDGEEHDVSGSYRDVVPAERLVFSWMWKSMPDRPSRVTISLKADGGGTLLTLTHEELYDEATRDDHRTGWAGALDNLERYLA